MKFNILTLFPNMFSVFDESIIKRAKDKNILNIDIIDIRKFANNKHNKVDSTPYGGGAGMIIKPDVLKSALESIKDPGYIIYLSPKGNTLDNEKVKEFSKKENITLIAGHYEGIDQRFIDKYVDEEISIGDYILSGGEIPAMVLIDTVARHIEGVITDESLEEESFENYLLEYPHYTKPYIFEGIKVPDILISGNHQEIKKYRRIKSLEETYYKRKDLLVKAKKKKLLSNEELEYLENLKQKERKKDGRN